MWFNLIKWDIKAHRKSLLIWSTAMIALIYSGMIKYGGYSASGQDIKEMMSGFPEVLKAFFAIGFVDISTLRGFYVIFYVYFAVMAAIHATMLGAAIVAKEEYDKTADFLLTRPIKRSAVISAKAIATLIQLAFLNLVTMVTSILVVAQYNKGEQINGLIIKLMIGMFFLQLLFMTLGFCFAAIIPNPKKSASYAAGLLMTTYLLSVAIDVNNNLEPLKLLTPFKYFDGKVLGFGVGFQSGYILLSIALMAALMIATYYFYQKRDIHS